MELHSPPKLEPTSASEPEPTSASESKSMSKSISVSEGDGMPDFRHEHKLDFMFYDGLEEEYKDECQHYKSTKLKFLSEFQIKAKPRLSPSKRQELYLSLPCHLRKSLKKIWCIYPAISALI